MYGQGVRDCFHLYLVRIVDDDVELPEPSIVDHERCRLLRAVVDVTMSVHVGDGLSVARVPQQLHGVRDDGLVSVDVSLATGRGHCIAEPLETRNRIVLDDLVDVRHLESVVQIPSQQGRCEQYLITSITAHEHAPRSRHDAVLFGVSAHERSEIVARHTDVLEHGLHLGKVLTQLIKCHIRSYRTRFRHARRSGSVATSSSTARVGVGEMQHPDTFYGRISSHLLPLAFPQLDDLDKVK